MDKLAHAKGIIQRLAGICCAGSSVESSSGVSAPFQLLPDAGESFNTLQQEHPAEQESKKRSDRHGDDKGAAAQRMAKPHATPVEHNSKLEVQPEGVAPPYEASSRKGEGKAFSPNSSISSLNEPFDVVPNWHPLLRRVPRHMMCASALDPLPIATNGSFDPVARGFDSFGERSIPKGGSGVPVSALVRYMVNAVESVSVFVAVTEEDFKDIERLLPTKNARPLPSSDKMTTLIARLDLHPEQSIADRLSDVNNCGVPMADAVGPAVGCLMATFGTNMISSCIVDFEDPEDLETFAGEERIELWGLQIPHARPLRAKNPRTNPVLAGMETETEEQSVAGLSWSSIDRLNMSVGLLYALCVNATARNFSCGLCVPKPKFLKRWQGAGVRMKEVTTKTRLIYPPHACDFDHYKSATVGYFIMDQVQKRLRKKLSLLD